MRRFKGREISGICPICQGGDLHTYRARGNDRPQTMASITRPTYGISGILVRCERCEAIFVHPFPSEESLRLRYEAMKDEAYLEEEKSRRKMAERSLCFIETFGKKGRLLDVGCFSGFFLDVARSRGWEGIGIEPSSWARAVAQERFGLPILGKTLEEASFPSNSFEAVTFIDTLEHLRDPKRALLEARRILKEDGTLYVSTPDIGSLAAHLLGDRWWGFRQEHLIYFSKKSLACLLQSLGFVIVSRRPYCRYFTVNALLRRLREMNPLLSRLLWPIGQMPGIGDLTLSVNFFDQIELLSRKG